MTDNIDFNELNKTLNDIKDALININYTLIAIKQSYQNNNQFDSTDKFNADAIYRGY